MPALTPQLARRRTRWLTAVLAAVLVVPLLPGPTVAGSAPPSRVGVGATDAPGRPQQVRVVRRTPDALELAWKASSRAAVASYEVHRDDKLIATVGATDRPRYIDSGLRPDRVYRYEIVAVDATGAESSRSAPATGRTERHATATGPDTARHDPVSLLRGRDAVTADLAGPHATFQKGDIFVSTGGSIQWRLPDWTLNGTISMGGGFATGIAFDSEGSMWAVDSSLNRLLKFNSSGTLILTVNGMVDPRSIAADGLGNIFVGQHQWSGPQGWINRLNLAGQFTAWWDVPAQFRSVDSLDMQADGCTLHYVGLDDNFVGPSDDIYHYDACNAVTAGMLGGWRFNTVAWGVRALPDGGDLAALQYFNAPQWWPIVTRYATSGALQDFVIPGLSRPQALDLLPLGDRYLVGDYDTGNVYEVETGTGAVIATRSTGASTVRALTVFRGTQLPNLPPPPGTEHNPPYESQGGAGDPANTYTGSFADGRLDVAIPGRGPSIRFERIYNSNDPRATTLGPGWTHSYNVRLTSPGDSTADVILVGPMGRSDRYTESGGSYTPPTGVDRTLVANEDGTWTATDRNRLRWTFDGIGRLTAITDRFGNASTLTYNALGQLERIGDPAGRGSLVLAYDTSGRLTFLTDWASPARQVRFGYDANGRLANVTDREGKVTTYGYDGSSHRLATITDARSNTSLTLTYDAQGRVATQRDARGLVTGDTTTFDYVVNSDGTRVTTVTAPPTSFEPSFSPTVVDTYDADARLVSRTTAPSSSELYTQTFTYDAAGNRTSTTDARGATTDFCYDVSYAGVAIPGSSGRLTRRIDPPAEPGAARAVTLFQYDAAGNLVQTVDPLGVPSGASVSCATNLSAITARYATDFGYDGAGVYLLSTTTRSTDPEAGARTSTVKYEYGDPANPGRTTRIIAARGNTGPSPDYAYATTMSYYGPGSQAGLLRESSDALGNRTTYTYDAVGRLASTVGQVGNAAGGSPAADTTQYTYDREDRLRFESRAAPATGGAALVTEIRYDAVGNPIVQVAPDGQVTTFAFDQRNALSLVTQSAATWTNVAAPPTSLILTEYGYDAGGNVIRVTRAKGDAANERATDYAYDGRGLLRRETEYPAWPSHAGALVRTTTYEAGGSPLGTVDPLGRSTAFAHDDLGRLTAIDYSDAGTDDVGYTYDVVGNRTSMVDGLGTTTYAYDEAGRLLTVTRPGSVVGYRYDLDGNRVRVIYPGGQAVTYAFDAADRLSSLTDWASRNVTYGYWPDGLLRVASLPNGTTTSYAYDNARRLTEVSHTGPSGQVIERSTSILDPLGNVASTTDGSLVPQFARPDATTGSSGTWTGGPTSINETTPNDATFLASPSGPAATTFYEVGLGDVEPPGELTGLVLRYRYAKSGNNAGQTINLTVELRQGTTVIASQVHSNIAGVAGAGWQLGTLALTPAQAGAISNIRDLRIRFRPVAVGGGQKRAAQVSWAEFQAPGPGHPASLISYGYDRLSRLTTVTGATGNRTYAYDAVGNRVSSSAAPGVTSTFDRADRLVQLGATSVTVDDAGNLVARGTSSYQYDGADRLVAASVGGVSESYGYDGDGSRIQTQTAAAPAVSYVNDVNRALPVALTDGTRSYVYGLGLAYAVSGSTIEVMHADRQGSIRAITDGAGAVVATYRTDEWGQPISETGASTQPLGYTGEPVDGTGLVYLRARYYDPAIGQFTSRDTWPGRTASPETLNRYAYVGGNPATSTDPSGHCVVDTIFDIAFVGVDVISLVFGPEKERGLNAVALGADVGAAFLPCVAGAGIVVRAGLKVSHGFGTLAHASQYGIRSYDALRTALQGTKLQAHHILPQRFAGLFGQNVGDMASVAVSQTEHNVFTQAWRQLIPYGAGTQNATQQQVLDAAREIYKDYPDLLRAIGL